MAIKDKAEIDAVFVSCTSVRLAEAAAEIEKEIGLPVTSSNHAMAWHALRLAGVSDAMPQWGRLFTLPMRAMIPLAAIGAGLFRGRRLAHGARRPRSRTCRASCCAMPDMTRRAASRSSAARSRHRSSR